MPLKINLTEERMAALDPGKMLGMTLELPAQIERGLELGANFVSRYNLERIADVDWMGLGGSAVAGDLMQGFGFEPPKLPLRIRVLRSARTSSAKRMVCSYSGNTVEALHAFEEVPADRIWFSASSGGTLKTLALRVGTPHLELPAGYPPRAAVGFMLGALPAIFEKLYGFNLTGLRDALAGLKEDAAIYHVLDVETNPALALALKLVDRTPVIYSVDEAGMAAIAFRFRAQLAENSKVWSHDAALPEMAHNEVESYAHLAQLLPPPLVILLGSHAANSPFADPRIGLRKLLDRFQIQHITLDPVEIWGMSLPRMASGLRTMFLLDAATIFLAIIRALNPLEIPIITQLKKISSPA
jgi:glucose/mannose-6-phosphate isomerase